MNKEDLYKRILEEKTVIDPLLWVLKIEEQVDKSHQEYVRDMAERYKLNPKIIKQLEEYFKLWKL